MCTDRPERLDPCHTRESRVHGIVIAGNVYLDQTDQWRPRPQSATGFVPSQRRFPRGVADPEGKHRRVMKVTMSTSEIMRHTLDGQFRYFLVA